MVSKVYGKADGVDITFYHDHGDIWQIDVPWNDDGKYTAEIFAEDDGGNITFRCSALFVISGHELQAVVMLNEMSAQVGCEKIKYCTEIIEEQFAGSVQEGGYQIESVICSRSHVLIFRRPDTFARL